MLKVLAHIAQLATQQGSASLLVEVQAVFPRALSDDTYAGFGNWACVVLENGFQNPDVIAIVMIKLNSLGLSLKAVATE